MNLSNESLLALVAILTACAPFAASILQYTKESRQASKDAAQLVLKNLRDDYERVNKELDESQTECAKWEVIARERQSVVNQKDDEISHLKYELRQSVAEVDKIQKAFAEYKRNLPPPPAATVGEPKG